MKKFTAIIILSVLLFALISCGEQESPPAYLPSIQYDGAPLDALTLLVYRTNGEISVGGNEDTDSLVKQNVSRVTFTEISNGKIELKNGSDKTVAYSIAFTGVYDENGDITNYTDNALSTLPAGKYIIVAQVNARRAEFSEVFLYMAGVEKK